MVWTAGESPLYKCVEKFNSTPREKFCAVDPKPCDEPERRASAKKADPPPDCPSCAQKPCRESEPECPRRETFHNPPPPPRTPTVPVNLLQRITSDRDFLLIAALILLLLHEKADMKLIAALAFIILT